MSKQMSQNSKVNKSDEMIHEENIIAFNSLSNRELSHMLLSFSRRDGLPTFDEFKSEAMRVTDYKEDNRFSLAEFIEKNRSKKGLKYGSRKTDRSEDIHENPSEWVNKTENGTLKNVYIKGQSNPVVEKPSVTVVLKEGRDTKIIKDLKDKLDAANKVIQTVKSLTMFKNMSVTDKYELLIKHDELRAVLE